MKKLTVLLAIVSIMVFVLSGCSKGETFTEKGYQSGESEIENIVIQVTDRELEISASEDDQIHIDYFDSEKEYLDISVSSSNELTVRLVTDKEWTDWIGTKPAAEYRKIKIKIPNHLLAGLTANTTNEAITISSLSFMENVNLTTNGGDIVCESIDVGKGITLTAKNGDITGSVIGGWDDFSIACEIKKGECNLPAKKEGGEKYFSADCNNGNINIEFVE